MGANGDDNDDDDGYDDYNDDDGSRTLTTVMMEHFQGDFDNYNQVVLDRQDGRLPREGGGHEHIHCTLMPLSQPTARLAAFYFDGLPQRIFRFRYYQLQPPQLVDSKTLTVVVGGDPKDENTAPQTRTEMRLFTLNPELEALLRVQSEDPTVWRSIFDSFVKEKSDSNISAVTPTIAVDRLPKCEVSWSMDMDPVQHAYVTVNGDARQTEGADGGVHAVMVHGEAIVDSTMIPGAKIRVLDQLSLFPDVFYINDRGLDPATGAFIYGNQRNVPYRLDRVTRVVQNPGEDGSIRRRIVNADLEWTLGQKWREVSLYETKMDAIGGPSTRMNVNRKGV
jgi:hypothetical protein